VVISSHRDSLGRRLLDAKEKIFIARSSDGRHDLSTPEKIVVPGQLLGDWSGEGGGDGGEN
jgi:hypothetical protein